MLQLNFDSHTYRHRLYDAQLQYPQPYNFGYHFQQNFQEQFCPSAIMQLIHDWQNPSATKIFSIYINLHIRIMLQLFFHSLLLLVVHTYVVFTSFNQVRLANISLCVICIMLWGKACHSMASLSMAYRTFCGVLRINQKNKQKCRNLKIFYPQAYIYI